MLYNNSDESISPLYSLLSSNNDLPRSSSDLVNDSEICYKKEPANKPNTYRLWIITEDQASKLGTNCGGMGGSGDNQCACGYITNSSDPRYVPENSRFTSE